MAREDALTDAVDVRVGLAVYEGFAEAEAEADAEDEADA